MRKLSTVEWLFLAVVLMCAASVGLGAVFVTGQLDSNRTQSRDGAVAKQALCVLKADLVQRVEQSKAFLKDHPDGIPGISPATIQAGIDNQQRTIDSLASLNCPSQEGTP